MQKFTYFNSQVIPLPIKDIDTDMIIPAQYLTRTDSNGFGEFLFQRLREDDPSFPLNLNQYKEAKIIAARDNFGCGSSREHAVWALKDWGIRVVIAPSFADIFSSNSGKNGLVLVKLPVNIVEKIIIESTKSDYKLEVNLERQEVILPNNSVHKFSFDPFRKECIINGFDDLQYILATDKEITDWNKNRNQNIFYKTTNFNYNQR